MHDAPQVSSPATPTRGGVRSGGAGWDVQGTGGDGGAMGGELQEARAQVEMLKGKVVLLEQQAREREAEREREMQQRVAQARDAEVVKASLVEATDLAETLKETQQKLSQAEKAASQQQRRCRRAQQQVNLLTDALGDARAVKESVRV